MNIGNFFKNEKFAKVIMGVLIFLLILIVAGLFAVRAEDNKTIDKPKYTSGGFPIILDEGKWSSQILYDTIGACYQGTIRWVILSNPSLINQMPSPMAQRQMVEHCFCVMDKIRKEIKYREYIKKVTDQNWTGNFFMVKAAECVAEYETLPSFFMKIPTLDNETKKENKLIIKPEEPLQDSQEESPDQPKEESEGSPQTIFQG
ncbi:uncharacterized protein METZ01_LOCUS418154 [marine metagenome]|uniref:Uncharacterized protein n=1 Tax=marine metagenome TaxID=408172 RepID=A0A382X364_9ZZZZ